MASSEILAKIGLNSAGFKTGLAQCKLAANSFKSSIVGWNSGLRRVGETDNRPWRAR